MLLNVANKYRKLGIINLIIFFVLFILGFFMICAIFFVHIPIDIITIIFIIFLYISSFYSVLCSIKNFIKYGEIKGNIAGKEAANKKFQKRIFFKTLD